jgi:hypothetical protein
MRLLAIPILSLLALPLGAQGFSVNANLLQAQDSLKKATGGTLAFSAGAAFDTVFYGSTIPARVGLSLASMPGKERSGLKTSLTLAQLSGDIFLETAPRLRTVVGLSLNRYFMTTSGAENTQDALDQDHHFPMHDTQGIKLGIRLGLDYRLSPSWTLELLFQQTELAGKNLAGDTTAPDGTSLVRQGGINPGWLQLGATYHF